jgi:hypothetical protein
MTNAHYEAPIWGPGWIAQSTSDQITWSVTTATASGEIALLDKAERLIGANDPASARDILLQMDIRHGLARPLLLDCLLELEDYARIVNYFDPPSSIRETLALFQSLWHQQHFDRLAALLDDDNAPGSSDTFVQQQRSLYRRKLQYV